MTRFALTLCLLAAPAIAVAQSTEEKAELPDIAADALIEKAGSAERVKGLEMSRPFKRGGAEAMCATTNAYDANGNFIGLTYWQLEFNDEGTEVKTLRNVTGLNSDCYSEKYKGFKN